MSTLFLFFIVVVATALIFDFINGFHDAANAIATVVATKVMSARVAVIYGATLNFVGALMGTSVAATIGKGLVDQGVITLPLIQAALLSGIIWNLFTWYLGIPTSSSHALIGSILGAVFFSTFSSHGIHWNSVLQKVVIPMFLSPVMGLVIGFTIMAILSWLVFKMDILSLKKRFGRLQIISAGLMALSHGHNDAQKAMGVIAMGLVFLHPDQVFTVPLWVILSCATAMGLGSLWGGWRIIRTIGAKMVKLQPVHGFAAETTSAVVILGASHFGIPVSTTQVVSSAILGVGATRRLSAVKWDVVRRILWAWALTIPATFCLSGLLTLIMKAIF